MRFGGKRRGKRLGALLALTGIAIASRGGADEARPAPRTSSLSWIRLPSADACVSTQDLARDVEARLGRAVFVSPSRADVSVEGRVERSGSGYVATITLRDAKGAVLGTRELRRDVASCDAMREPLALVVSVMIDPDAALRAPSTAPSASTAPTVAALPSAEPAKPEPAKPEPAKPEPVKPEPAKPSAPLRFGAGASLAGAAGLLPGVALGLGVDALLEPHDFIGLRGFGSVWFDDAVAAPPGAGRATFSLLLAGAGLCPLTFRRPVVSLHACASGEIGRLTSRGTGFDVPLPDAASWVIAGSLDARLAVRVGGPFALRAGLAGLVPFSRNRFVASLANGGESEIFRMSPVVGVGELGVGVELP